MATPPITIAVPKGRLLAQLTPRLAPLGVTPDSLSEHSNRKLVRETTGALPLRFLLLKPDDVPTYVEYGAADIGVVGRDVLLERGSDLFIPLDLGLGRCRMVVAEPIEPRAGIPPVGHVPRVATKYPRIAAAHFAARGDEVEIIYVQGSVELAPLVGLSERIVDLVETGETLKQNGLTIRETVCDVSAVVVANRVGLKLRRREIQQLLDALARPSAPAQIA